MITKQTPLSELATINACLDARDWAKANAASLEEAWLKCERGDWLLWYAAKRNIDQKLLVKIACECARLALPYAKSPTVLICIETAEAWTRGEVSAEKVREARRAAYAYAYAYADAAAYAAYAAYAAAAYAYAYADAAAYAAAYAAAAYAAYAYADAAAYAAAYAAADAYAAAAYATAADAYATAARKNVLKQCADIVRKHIPDLP